MITLQEGELRPDQPANALRSLQDRRPADWAGNLHFGLLRTFIVVAEMKSVTAASRALRVAPSVVSTHVRTLSRITGLTLTERRGGEIILTPAGRELYEGARRVAQSVASLRELVERVQGSETLTLTAVGARFACHAQVPAIVLPFLRINPHVHFQAVCVPSRETTSHVAIGDADLAFVEEGPISPPLSFRPLLTDRYCLILPRTASAAPVSIRPADLLQFNYMMFPRGHWTRAIVDQRLGAVAAQLNVIAEIDSMLAIMHSVEAGHCAGFLPESMLSHALARGTLVTRDIEGVDLSRTLGIVTDPNRGASPALELFLQWLDHAAARQCSAQNIG